MEQNSNKMMKTGIGKPFEHGHIRKQHQSKFKSSETNRSSCIKSKAGFKLYSKPFDTAKPTKIKIHKTSTNTKKAQQDEQEIEENFPQNTEAVVSQIQLEAESNKQKEALDIVIPAAESDGDNTGHDPLVFQEFGTPFNKRLISSTPDPERLLEAEFLEQQKNHLTMMCPQMIPEKDTTLPSKSSVAMALVASSLKERLKLQRQNYQHLSAQKQKQDKKPSPSKSLENNITKHHIFSKFLPNNDLPSSTSLPVSKAEWAKSVVDYQNLHKSEMVSKSVSSNNKLDSISSVLPSTSNTSDNFSSMERIIPVTGIDSKGGQTASTMMAMTNVQFSSTDTNMCTTEKSSQFDAWSYHPHWMDNLHDKDPSIKQYQTLKNGTALTNAPEDVIINDKSNASTEYSAGFEKQRSAFSKPESSTLHFGVTNITLNNFVQSTGKPIIENTSTDKNALSTLDGSKWNASADLNKRFIIPKTQEQDSQNSNLAATKDTTKTNLIKQMNEDSGIENTYSSLKLLQNEARKIHTQIEFKCKSQMSDDKNHQSPADDLDTTVDTCDLEVTVLYEHKEAAIENKKLNPKLDETIDSMIDENSARKSVSSDSGNLSQVIEFLKSDAFNKVNELQVVDKKSMVDKVVQRGDDITEPNTELQINKQQLTNNRTLDELMKLYLPEKGKENVDCNNSKYVVNDINNCVKEDGNKSLDQAEEEVNVNQNNFYNDKGHNTKSSGPQRKLKYLERMADPTLRDIACRLTLKATALRDVELRDLIDEMILHTDFALGQEDAHAKSSQLFFIEENNKLKKRLQITNQQLEARERQERAGTNNVDTLDEVLHLEKKIMYLTQEKDKLDNQVTTLLAEKGKWLITQQDLVRTISLKDHDILKLEERHREEKKSLHQSLDLATKNSQGVHYKLSMADRDISNLEQSVRTRNMKIIKLKEKLEETEGKFLECERQLMLKDQEMIRLQDLVDSLKIGVDHVLQAYESSCNKDSTTTSQRQGIENLYQMVHPEKYRTLSDPGDITHVIHRAVSGHGSCHCQKRISPSKQLSGPEESHRKRHVEQTKYNNINTRSSRVTQPPQRHHSMEDSDMRVSYHSQYRSKDDVEQGKLSKPLTFQTLEEHNRRLSPIDRTLWRSLADNSRVSRNLGEDPYYSDSEIEVHGHRQGRHSNRFKTSSNLHHLRLSRIPSVEQPHHQHSRERHDNHHQHELRDSQTTKYSTLRSETIPKSLESKDSLSDETAYSTLRSQTLTEDDFNAFQNHVPPHVHYTSEAASYKDNLAPRDHHQTDSKKLFSPRQEKLHPAELTDDPEKSHSKFFSSVHFIPEHRHQNGGHDHRYSLIHDHSHTSGRSVPGYSRDLKMDQENADFAHSLPEHSYVDQHGLSQHRLRTYPHSDIAARTSEQPEYRNQRHCPQHTNYPIQTTAHSDHEQQRHLSRSKANALSHSYPGTHFRDVQGHESNSEQSLFLNDVSGSTDCINDLSISRRATRDSESLTQREFFHGTELSLSLSSISEADPAQSLNNNNGIKSLNENTFCSGIATLDEKIADLQRKIDRTKKMFS